MIWVHIEKKQEKWDVWIWKWGWKFYLLNINIHCSKIFLFIESFILLYNVFSLYLLITTTLWFFLETPNPIFLPISGLVFSINDYLNPGSAAHFRADSWVQLVLPFWEVIDFITKTLP